MVPLYTLLATAMPVSVIAFGLTVNVMVTV